MAMRNVAVKQTGNKLVITVDLSAKAELSKSQLSYVVASTGGLQAITPGIRLNLNLTKDRDDLTETDRAALRSAAKAARAGK